MVSKRQVELGKNQTEAMDKVTTMGIDLAKRAPGIDAVTLNRCTKKESPAEPAARKSGLERAGRLLPARLD